VSAHGLPERIFLVGFMGAGKTTVGRALAERAGYAFLDTDAEVEARAGRSIEELFHAHGEGYFREREWEALLAVAGRTRLVVATGGGLFLAEAHRDFIRRHGVSVWLDVPLEAVWERCRELPGRPLFTTRAELAELLAARRARYALADHRVAVGGQDAETIAAEIWTWLRGVAPADSPADASAAAPHARGVTQG
jgi:shikimate kinase